MNFIKKYLSQTTSTVLRICKASSVILNGFTFSQQFHGIVSSVSIHFCNLTPLAIWNICNFSLENSSENAEWFNRNASLCLTALLHTHPTMSSQHDFKRHTEMNKETSNYSELRAAPVSDQCPLHKMKPILRVDLICACYSTFANNNHNVCWCVQICFCANNLSIMLHLNFHLDFKQQLRKKQSTIFTVSSKVCRTKFHYQCRKSQLRKAYL